MRRLSGDLVLWKYFYHCRNPAIVSLRLSRRPERIELVDSNIMKGVQPRQIREGLYVSGPNMKVFHDAQTKLERSLLQQRMIKALRSRPDIKSLQQKGVLMRPIAPFLQPKVVALGRALQQIALKKKLQNRKSATDLVGGVMKGVSSFKTAPSLAATRVELERHFSENVISRKISTRPNASDIERVIGNTWLVAQIVCPNVKPKIRMFEAQNSVLQ